MNSRKVLLRSLLVLLVMSLSVFAVSAQKDATPVPAGESEDMSDEATDILTLPILFDGEVRELTLEGTTGAILAAFNASEGDVVDISMSSDDIDPFIVILTGDGFPVAMNDDSDGLDSLIEGFEVPADGSYFILATTFSGRKNADENADGSFELLVEGNTQPASIDEDSFSYAVYTLEIGESFDVEIDADFPAYLLEFYGEAGQEVTIDAPSDDVDTLMMLFDISGNRIAVDDDGGDELFAAHIELELPESGYYLLLLTTYNFDDIADGASVTDGIVNLSSR